MCLPNLSDACLIVWGRNMECIKRGPEEARDVPNEMSPRHPQCHLVGQNVEHYLEKTGRTSYDKEGFSGSDMCGRCQPINSRDNL